MTTQRFLFANADEFVSDVVRISDTLRNLTYSSNSMLRIPDWCGSMRSRPINCCGHWKTWFIRPMLKFVRVRVRRSASGAGCAENSWRVASQYFVVFGRPPISRHGSLGGVMALQSDLFMDADEFVVDAMRVADTLGSLTHLVCWNDEDAGLVQLYARQLDERLRGLRAVLRCTDPNLREARARLCN